MSWTRVQNIVGGGTHSSSYSLAFSSSVTAGNLVTVGVASYGPGTVTVKDSINSVNYTQAVVGQNPSAVYSGIFWYVPPTGGSSFTIEMTSTSSGYPALFLNEWSYSGATFSQDATGSNNSTSNVTSLATSSTLTITGPDLIYALACLNTTETFTQGSGFTLGNTIAASGGAHVGGGEEYILGQASGLLSPPSMSWTATAAAAIAAAAFLATASGVVFVPYQSLFRGMNFTTGDI